MKYLIILCCTFLTLFIFRFFYNRFDINKTVSNKNSDAKETILKMPKIVFYSGIFGFIFFALLTIYTIFFQPEDWPYIILLTPFGLFCAMLSIYWMTWKVEIKHDEFSYRNFLGITKTYKYSEIEIKFTSKYKTYFSCKNKKIISIPYYIDNGNMLEKTYKKWKAKSNKQDFN